MLNATSKEPEIKNTGEKEQTRRGKEERMFANVGEAVGGEMKWDESRKCGGTK